MPNAHTAVKFVGRILIAHLAIKVILEVFAFLCLLMSHVHLKTFKSVQLDAKILSVITVQLDTLLLMIAADYAHKHVLYANLMDHVLHVSQLFISVILWNAYHAHKIVFRAHN